MATQATTSIRSSSPPPQAELDAVARCLETHTQALLVLLATAGDAWDASPHERRLLAGLVDAQSSQQQAVGR
jgi:hypothetical protein